MSKTIVYTADDEDPNCGRCDNCDLDSEYFCVHSCGPEHGWNGYERTEVDLYPAQMKLRFEIEKDGEHNER